MAVDGLVSVIIPVYNRPRLVAEAINSVLAQSYRPIEILVVDDGSSDETLPVLQKLAAAHPEINVVTQKNSGPGAARQRGLEACNGEFIQFLDSDDLLLPDKFRKQIAMLAEHPECGACYGWTIRYPMDSPKDLTPVKWTGSRIETMFPSFLSDRWWDTSTPLYRSSIIHRNGPWLNLRQEEDWEFDCRLAATGVRLAYLAEIVSETRVLTTDRLSAAGSSSRELLSDRCTARSRILGHAIAANVGSDDTHMRTFLKSSFLVARQAASVGLERESEDLIKQLNDFDPESLKTNFLRLGKLIGFRRTSSIAEVAYTFLGRKPNG